MRRRRRCRSRRARSATCARPSPTSPRARPRRRGGGSAARRRPRGRMRRRRAARRRCPRRRPRSPSTWSKEPVLTLPTCAQTIVGPSPPPSAVAQQLGAHPPLLVGGNGSICAAADPEVAQGAVDGDVALLADDDADPRRALEPVARDDPSRPRARTWCRAAASAVMCAIWQPVTKPAETPAGQPQQLAQPAERDLLDDAPRSATAPIEAGVLIPGRGQPVGRDRGRQRAADDEAEVAARSASPTIPGSAAAISSATTCPVLAAVAPAAARRARLASSSTDACGSNRPLVERADGTATRSRPSGRAGPSRGPQRSKIDRRIPGLPALQEALDRRVEDDAVELVEREDPVAADGLVRSSETDSSEPSTSPAKMMWTTCFVTSAPFGAIESTSAIGPSKRGGSIPTSSADLAADRVHQRLAGVDAAAREQPDVALPRFSCRHSSTPPPPQRRSAETRIRGSARITARSTPLPTSRTRRRRARSRAAPRPPPGARTPPRRARAARSAFPARRRTARARRC